MNLVQRTEIKKFSNSFKSITGKSPFQVCSSKIQLNCIEGMADGNVITGNSTFYDDIKDETRAYALQMRTSMAHDYMCTFRVPDLACL